jgi:predicted O-methyltransferase YrrM
MQSFETVPYPGPNWFPKINEFFLEGCIKNLPPNSSILEIGSWLGRSTAFIYDQRPDMALTCIDTWEGSHNHTEEQTKELYQNFCANMHCLDMLTSIEIIKDKSSNVLDHFEKNTLDLIYIDGSHQEEDVFIDMNNAYKLLKPGGFIVADDWGHTGVSRGLMTAYWQINLDDSENLGPIVSHTSVFQTQKLR